MSDDSGRPDLAEVAEDRIVDRQPDVVVGGPFIPPASPDPRAYLYGEFGLAVPGDVVFKDTDSVWRAGVPASFGIPTAQKGAANGVAPLDATGKVPSANLPATSGSGPVINAPSTDKLVPRWDQPNGRFAWKIPGAVDVRDFGAVGDGIVNDRAAIQNAIDFANTNKLAVYAPRPSAEYKLGSSLTLYSNLTIYSEGGAIRQPANASALTGTGLSNLTIRGLTFNGNGGSTDTGSGIEIQTCSRVLVQGCYYTNQATGSGTGGAGAVFNNCSHVRFIGNEGLNAGYALANFFNSRSFIAVGNSHTNTRGSASTLLSTCIYANSGSTDFAIVGNASEGDTYPFEVRIGCKRGTVAHNSIKDCKQIGVVVQTDAPNAASPCTDITVVNNPMEMATGSTEGILLDSVNDCSAIDNPIVGGCSTAQIRVTRAGAAANGQDNSVVNNRLRSGDEMGIRVETGCVRTDIVINKVKSTTDNRSIYVEGNDGHIHGNRVYDSGFHGIDIQGTGNELADNRVKVTRNNGKGIIAVTGNRVLTSNRVDGSTGVDFDVIDGLYGGTAGGGGLTVQADKVANFNITQADAKTLIPANKATAITGTIRNDANSTWASVTTDQYVQVMQKGVGQFTFAPESPAVLHAAGASLSTRTQWSVITAVRLGANEYVVYGDTA